MANDSPEAYVATMSKQRRKGKIFVDYLRNDATSTAVAPFSARARDGATVSMPLDWKQLTPSLDPKAFTVETVPRLLQKRRADPWADFLKVRQKVKVAYLKKLGIS